MARWRRSGKNWEGRPWTITPALSVLLDELEEHYPVGNSSVDGTVASKGHDAANPSSDHRPHPLIGTGVVRAVDVAVSGTEGAEISEALRSSRDPRIRYVIYNRRIFASYHRPHRKPWEWGPYDGASPHTNHIHISVQDDNNTQPWNLFQPPDEEEEYMLTTPQFVRRLDATDIHRVVAAGIIKGHPDLQTRAQYWIELLDHPEDPAWEVFRQEVETARIINQAVGGW